MSKITIPSVTKQLHAQKFLIEFRPSRLVGALRETVAQIDPSILHAEAIQFASQNGMRILQALGVREEEFFAFPAVLEANPRLLGYYRLLLGFSEKAFYTSNSGLLSFRKMEMEGLLDKLTREDLNALCAALNEAADTFLEAAVKESLALDVRDLPVMTLGAYADGAWRNIVGRRSAESVFHAVKNIFLVRKTQVEVSGLKNFVFTNKRGKRIEIFVDSDPDLGVVEDGALKRLCVEIKGGQDVSNIHNRAGEAEKSHQKARALGWRNTWTLIALSGLSSEQLMNLKTESPSTSRWFDVNEVCAERGRSYEEFKGALIELLD